MKKRIACAAVAALACNLAMAQPPDGGSRHGPRGERIAAQLGLNETQSAEVKRIFAEAQTRMEAARTENRQTVEAELAKVLTPEQLAEFKQLKSERRHGRKPSRPPASGT